MKKTNRWETCSAPICRDDRNPHYKEEVVWYAGEPVCTQTPYTKYQKKQLAINKEVKTGKFKLTTIPLTAHYLETRSI